MIKKIAFFFYPVKDMDRARKFYEGALGLNPTENYDNAWVEYDLNGGCFCCSRIIRKFTPCS